MSNNIGSFFTWTTTFSVMFLTKFFGDLEFIERYVETYQGKLGAGYHLIASTLNDNHIPFSSADSGVFIFLDLSGWLHHFSTSVDGASSDQKADRLRAEEMELCRYLIDQGVFISPGQVRLNGLRDFVFPAFAKDSRLTW